MGNLLKISLIIISFLICACTPKYEISSNINVNNVEHYHENLYLDEIDFKVDKNNDIHIDNENWNILKTNIIKIHYHILKLQEQLK